MHPIPTVLITGFLGSGKTTLLGQVLSQPGFDRSLVVVNEFGAVGIDHDLLEASSEDTILLANGCLCCTIRGNLVDTLLDAHRQLDEGRLRRFDRVLIETSGLADPPPLLAFLLGNREVMARFAVPQVVATCDAVNGLAQFERHREAEHQIRVADRLLITKTDLAPAGELARITARLRQLNREADIWPVDHGRIDAARLLDFAAGDAARYRDAAAGDHHGDGHGGTASLSLTAAAPLDQARLAALLAILRDCAGPALLRVKAVLPVSYDQRAVVIQAAMAVVHEPSLIATTPRTGRLVAIAGHAVLADLRRRLEPLGLSEVG